MINSNHHKSKLRVRHFDHVHTDYLLRLWTWRSINPPVVSPREHSIVASRVIWGHSSVACGRRFPIIITLKIVVLDWPGPLKVIEADVGLSKSIHHLKVFWSLAPRFRIILLRTICTSFRFALTLDLLSENTNGLGRICGARPAQKGLLVLLIIMWNAKGTIFQRRQSGYVLTLYIVRQIQCGRGDNEWCLRMGPAACVKWPSTNNNMCYQLIRQDCRSNDIIN